MSDQDKILDTFQELRSHHGACRDLFIDAPYETVLALEVLQMVDAYSSPPLPLDVRVRPWWYHLICQQPHRFQDCAIAVLI